MRATVMYGTHDVRVETVPDARLIEPTDALVVVTRACICGSDLWPYNSMAHSETGNRMGHEFMGLVEAVGSDVRTVKKGDLVVAPFAWSDGTCEFCRRELQTSCLHGGWWGGTELDGLDTNPSAEKSIQLARHLDHRPAKPNAREESQRNIVTVNRGMSQEL
jgi:threonine dehydrogenase-like Zn-dependent dehydrogenase